MAKVTKEYRCYNCEKDFEAIVDHDKNRKQCSYCRSKNIERLISSPIISKLGDPRTVGSLIEQNNRKNPLTREQKVGSENDEKLKWKSHMKNMNKMSLEEKARYIKTGKTK